jgi:hypothetical protein
MSLALVFLAHREEPPANARMKSRLSWPFAIACCIYFLFTYGWLAIATPIFSALHQGLGVDIPLPTRILYATCGWLYPTFFTGAIALTIVKQCVTFDGVRLRIANIFLVFAAIGFAPVTVMLWYLPLFTLIWKLHSMK